MTERQAVTRERVASAAQYLLLGGFASVAAGISAGLTGFARSNMGLRGPWPYLLFFALDGAAGVCAVLLARRAARNDGGLAPRLAVWGLVTASAFFNFTHAPRARPPAGVRADARRRGRPVRVLPPRDEDTQNRPGRPQARRAALAAPGRAGPGPDAHGR